MQTKPMTEPIGSPVPSVSREPLRVHHHTVAERLTATPTASGTTGRAPSPGRRNAASIVLAKLLSAIRGDTYVVDAYPPAWHGAAAARTGDDVTEPSHDGEVAAGVRAGVGSGPGPATVASRTKER
jgi:hypothetical protein